MKNALEIIKRFGSQAKLARALGHKNNTVVAHWKKTGVIPRWRIHEIKQAARKKRIKVSDILEG